MINEQLLTEVFEKLDHQVIDLDNLFAYLRPYDIKIYTLDGVYHAEYKHGNTTYANYDLLTLLCKLVNEL